MGERDCGRGSDLQLKTVLENTLVPEIHNSRNVNRNEQMFRRE